MIQNKLFRDCLAAIPAEQKAEFDLSFGIAERISEILKAKGLTQKDFARLLNKRKHPIPIAIQLHPQCLLGIQSILRNWTFLIFKQV